MRSLSVILKKLKDKIYYYVVQKNDDINRLYSERVKNNPIEHQTQRWRHWVFLIMLNWQYRIEPRLPRFLKHNNTPLKSAGIRYFQNSETRMTMEELCNILDQYDIISFDIFDTAIYRKVEKPIDVFNIMSVEMGHNDFTAIRLRAEREARNLKEKTSGTREITLQEIYTVLDQRYGIDSSWLDREIELEIELSQPNPYISSVYNHLLDLDKTILFTTDMYLPLDVISELLKKNGYIKYKKIYLSNELGVRKGDGSLQQILLSDFEGQKIVHVGDNRAADVEKSISIGLPAVYNPDSHLDFRESDMDNLAGSFYRAIINTQINNGTWDKNLWYEHGFRVGGILAAGFCQYLNRLSVQKNIDKIIFCARDCYILHEIYNQFYSKIQNEYMQISRYAIFHVTSERYLYDFAERFILRHIKRNERSKTIGTILVECGFDFLVDYLANDNINQFQFPVAIGQKRIETFIFNHKKLIEEKSQPSVEAAKKYFAMLLGASKNILVVDIGWSGSCLTAFKYFIEKHFPLQYNIYGALMCTSRNRALTTALEDDTISSYVYSPFSNMDLTRFMMPGDARKRSMAAQDRLHMPLEFLFTSCERTLIHYKETESGEIDFERGGFTPPNVSEITDMQQGMVDFVAQFKHNTEFMKNDVLISPYVAFNPLLYAIKKSEYCKAVYGGFAYDSMTTPVVPSEKISYFIDLHGGKERKALEQVEESPKKKVLFVTPELIYTGAPRSLLRMCKVAIELGYSPVVWSAKSGPFAVEYEKFNIPIKIVPEGELRKRQTIRELKRYDMAVCNTIVTDRYAEVCNKYIPTVWYIREATNIPDFTQNNSRRLFILRHSKSIYCVSQYAAEAIGEFTKNAIHVIRNCVEDEVDMATTYQPGTAAKIRFVQFGTIEYRKGYDVLLAAYKAMPKEYQDQTELFFAGGFINSGTPFCSYLFRQMEGDQNVHYLGVVAGEENKIKTLSEMDVVVVASRDESCSLVALEGAMLSKPLIVTENVGAKYMVGPENGKIVKTADIESLRDAMMYMIDHRDDLVRMGDASRDYYERYANMQSYTNDMRELYSAVEKRHSFGFSIQAARNKLVYSLPYRLWSEVLSERRMSKGRRKHEDVIVSLTSHPGRIDTVALCIKTLLSQTSKPKKVLLWLSSLQFPNHEQDLPAELLHLTQKYAYFEIRWVDEDLAPHKKYFYTMQEYPEFPVIIVDDDVFYDHTLVEKLMKSYRKFPNCVSCMRANLIGFKNEHKLMSYEGWTMNYRALLDTPSYQLLPTGVGGVLYPPHALPESAFNKEAIIKVCLYCDDLWLKVFSAHNGFRVVVPRDGCSYKDIPGTEETALWRINVRQNNNDLSMRNILSYYNTQYASANELLYKLWKDRFA